MISLDVISNLVRALPPSCHEQFLLDLPEPSLFNVADVHRFKEVLPPTLAVFQPTADNFSVISTRFRRSFTGDGLLHENFNHLGEDLRIVCKSPADESCYDRRVLIHKLEDRPALINVDVHRAMLEVRDLADDSDNDVTNEIEEIYSEDDISDAPKSEDGGGGGGGGLFGLGFGAFGLSDTDSE